MEGKIQHIAIFTDLDGTFLDNDSYSFAESLPALRRAIARGWPVIFCSSKTDAEILALLEQLSLRLPFISENGGGIFLPAEFETTELRGVPIEGSWRVVPLGTDIRVLSLALHEVEGATGVSVRGLSEMTPEEVVSLTGLGPVEAELAQKRRYDEAFVVAGNDTGAQDAVCQALREQGLAVTRGGRFHHVMRGNDKGAAARLMMREFRFREPTLVSAGLGDSANDIPLLRAVDIPVLVQRPDGSYDGEAAAEGFVHAPAAGPAGWAWAVGEMLEGRLPARAFSASGRAPVSQSSGMVRNMGGS